MHVCPPVSFAMTRFHRLGLLRRPKHLAQVKRNADYGCVKVLPLRRVGIDKKIVCAVLSADKEIKSATDARHGR